MTSALSLSSTQLEAFAHDLAKVKAEHHGMGYLVTGFLE
jgi:hypothetical protein